jgi:uncharacterized damage-inducible protein DinB
MHAEIARIEDQLRRCFEAGAWHGPAVLETLEGVTHQNAHAHPIMGAHSIWELVLHLDAGYRLVLRRLGGDGSPLTVEQDWPAVPAPSAEAWQAAVRELARLNQDLRSAVRDFPAHRLDEPLVAQPPYSAYTQFIGLTQHDLYHAGQIVLLRRALARNAPTSSP